MATVQELQAQLRQLEAEESRLRALFDEFSTRIQSIFAQQRPLDVELRQQRSIIQDANASQAQKDAALDRALALEQQQRDLDNQVRRLTDEQNAFLNNQLRPIQQQIFSPGGLRDQVRQAETDQRAQDSQGPGTQSAGQTTAEAAVGRDTDAQTQSPPPAAEQLDGDDNVVVQPTNTLLTNAEETPTDAIPRGAAAPPKAGPDPVQLANNSTVASPLPTQQPQVGLAQPEVRQTYYYKAISVTSTFSAGRFTQDIEGALLITPVVRARPSDFPGSEISDISSAPTMTLANSQTDPGLLPDQAEAQAAALRNTDVRTSGLGSSSPGLPAVPTRIPSVALITESVQRLPGVPSVLSPAINALPTSGSTQIGLFNNAVDSTIARLSSNTPNDQLIYNGNDEIVWERVNTERLRRDLPGLAEIGSPRPTDARGSTQTTTYNTARET